jgi:hypothetical protein
VKFLESCTPGYYNNEGRPAERSVRNGSYGATSVPSMVSAPPPIIVQRAP